jgi:hypothetical protein
MVESYFISKRWLVEHTISSEYVKQKSIVSVASRSFVKYPKEIERTHPELISEVMDTPFFVPRCSNWKSTIEQRSERVLFSWKRMSNVPVRYLMI